MMHNRLFIQFVADVQLQYNSSSNWLYVSIDNYNFPRPANLLQVERNSQELKDWQFTPRERNSQHIKAPRERNSQGKLHRTDTHSLQRKEIHKVSSTRQTNSLQRKDIHKANSTGLTHIHSKGKIFTRQTPQDWHTFTPKERYSQGKLHRTDIH